MSAQKMTVKNYLLLLYWLIIYATEKNTCTYTYVVCTLYIQSVVWKLLEFPAMADDLHSYILQCLRKDFN